MIFAIIDLGTNTFNLLIATSLPNNTFKKLFNTKIAVKLGKGTINSGYIADVPFQSGINALKQYQRYLLDYNVEQVFAFATSAIRSASNGAEFVAQAKEKTGLLITVIDGDEEAELIYHGSKMAIHMDHQTSLIMDIGGGSIEFVLANDKTIFWKQSFLLGAARLLDKFKPAEPIKQREIDEFNTYLKQELQPLLEAVKIYQPIELVGSSGAFDSLVDMIAAIFNTENLNDSKTEYTVNLNHYHHISNVVKMCSFQERTQIKGLIDMRVDMIVISVLLIDFILKELNLHTMRVSTFSLKEGVISKKLGLSVS